MKVLGIDPGHKGALVLWDGKKFQWWPMPLATDGKNKSVDFTELKVLLLNISRKENVHVYLERAVPMAMGSKHAFNYGRDFQSIILAIEFCALSMTMIEPAKWSKAMHQGIASDLKTKAKSLVAAKRLFPKIFKQLPVNTKGTHLDGPIDALLIAEYALRVHHDESDNFF